MLGSWLGEGLVARVYAARKEGIEVETDVSTSAGARVSSSRWAVKVARSDVKGSKDALRRESRVLERLKGVSGVAELIVCGEGYLALPRYGANTADVRRKRSKECFSLSETVAIGRGMLRCLKNLHASGWIHRDVKPANFVFRLRHGEEILNRFRKRKRDGMVGEESAVLGETFTIKAEKEEDTKIDCNGDGFTAGSERDVPGMADEQGTIVHGEIMDMVLLDLGLAKRYTHSDGRHLSKRESVGFRGTPAYASPHAHAGEDLSRRDDLISLFFTLVELAEGKLPWKRAEDQHVGLMKQEFLTSKMEVLTPQSGKLLHKFAQHVLDLSFEETPDYDALDQALLQGLREAMNQPRHPQPSQIAPLSTPGSMQVISKAEEIIGLLASIVRAGQMGNVEAIGFLQRFNDTMDLASMKNVL